MTGQRLTSRLNQEVCLGLMVLLYLHATPPTISNPIFGKVYYILIFFIVRIDSETLWFLRRNGPTNILKF
ncbi:hypothetical protein HanPSC8_Chr03g0094711 [Helianthus annuus]|nr:hypothetical protein HanPSC8_Chr03g0094711 [Helianthus annuus]